MQFLICIMKKYKFLSAAAVIVLFLSGCSDSNQDTDITTTIPSNLEPAITTTGKISAVENQPEDTVAPDNTTESETITPVKDKPEGFPIPYPTAKTENAALLEELKDIITKAEVAESIFDGKNTLIPLTGTEKDGYKLISSDYAKDMTELGDRMYDGFKLAYWEDVYGKEAEELIPDAVKETDEGVWLKYGDTSDSIVSIDVSTTVIMDYGDKYADVIALGTKKKEGAEDEYIWRSYEMVKGNTRGWRVRMYTDEKVTGEIAVFSSLLTGTYETLDKIFGNADPVKTGSDWNPQLVTIENDIYGNGFYNGLEIEPFMTMEEMRQYIRNTFTSEIAESYISLYINRTYVEKDGRLYIISGSILPQMGKFSLDNYKNISTSTYSLTSSVEWNNGDKTLTVPITIAYEDGLWKLDTRLPMKEDRIIQ